MLTAQEKLIFGIKVKLLRRQKGYSFAELSKLTDISVSYLNEIENGKKHPKGAKAQILADVLETSVEDLSSPELPASLQPLSYLLQSNFMREVPLEMFGIDMAKVVEIIANAPKRVSAFISALIEISRKYEMQEESFFFAALRSYQKLFDNYFEEWEQKVDEFVAAHEFPKDSEVPLPLLYSTLKKEFKYKIDKSSLLLYPELRGIRSLYLPKKRCLLIHPHLDDSQQKFLLGKEIAYKYLKIKERVYTSNFVKAQTFEQAVHNFKSSYFSVALLLNKDTVCADMRQFFSLPTWQPEALLGILQKYGASPEMFFQRLTNLLPHFFGLHELFFLRFSHTVGTDRFAMTKELHLSRFHKPYGSEVKEHYCRRWVAIWLLKQLYEEQKQGLKPNIIVGIQRSQYLETNDEYLIITLARSGHPTPNTNISVTIGIEVNERSLSLIKFINDPNIPTRLVSHTCERCPATECQERAIAPLILDAERRQAKMNTRIQELLEED